MSAAFPVQRDDKSAPFFDAAAQGRLVVRRCDVCGAMLPPEAAVCTTCGGARLAWVDAAGTGRLVTWTIVHKAPNPAYAALVPYVVGVVELDEGPWLYAAIEATGPRAGMRLRAVYPDLAEGESFPVFAEEQS